MSAVAESDIDRILRITRRVDSEEPKKEDPTIELEEIDKSEHQHNEVSLPPLPTNITRKTFFSHPDSHPIALDIALIVKHGVEWLGWEPEVLHRQIEADFGPLSDLNMSKIQACKTLHLGEPYWNEWHVFGWCTMAFNGIFPDFDTMQVPNVSQVAISVDIANRLRDDVKWSDEVRLYIRTVFEHESIVVPTPPLDFVDIDTSHYDVNVQAIKQQWPGVRVSGKAPTDASVEDEQLRRMLEVHLHLEASRNRLRSQLPLVQHA